MSRTTYTSQAEPTHTPDAVAPALDAPPSHVPLKREVDGRPPLELAVLDLLPVLELLQAHKSHPDLVRKLKAAVGAA